MFCRLLSIRGAPPEHAPHVVRTIGATARERYFDVSPAITRATPISSALEMSRPRPLRHSGVYRSPGLKMSAYHETVPGQTVRHHAQGAILFDRGYRAYSNRLKSAHPFSAASILLKLTATIDVCAKLSGIREGRAGRRARAFGVSRESRVDRWATGDRASAMGPL